METRVFPCVRKHERSTLCVFNTASRHRVYVYKCFSLSPLSPCLHKELPDI